MRFCTNAVQIPRELWPEARRLHAAYKEARRLGVDNPKWQEAEASARGFAREIDGLNRHLRKKYPGGRAEQLKEELFEEICLTNQLLAHMV